VVDLQGEPRGLEAIRTQISDVRTITRQELIDAARAWLKPGERVEIRILPAPRKAGEQPPAATTTGK
jgi:hypothetical protein